MINQAIKNTLLGAAAAACLLTHTPTGFVQKPPATMTAAAQYTPEGVGALKPSLGFLGIPVGLVSGAKAIFKSVQYFPITLTAATSGTATITAVTIANSIVIPLGHTDTDTTDDPNKNMPYLAITSTTQITATLLAAGTMVIQGVIFEFKSSILKTNQDGSVSVTSALSNTATLGTAVTLANAICYSRGATYNSGTAAPETVNSRVYLSSTTQVTCKENGSHAVALVHYFTVFEFNAGIVKSVQQTAPSMSTATGSGNAALSPSVVFNNSLIFWGGYETTLATVDTRGNAPIVQLHSDGSQVDISCFDTTHAATVTATATVVEFYPANVSAAKQQASSTISSGSATGTGSISPSLAQASTLLTYLGATMQSTSTSSNQSFSSGSVTLHSDGSTADLARSGTTNDLKVGWNAIKLI